MDIFDFFAYGMIIYLLVSFSIMAIVYREKICRRLFKLYLLARAIYNRAKAKIKIATRTPRRKVRNAKADIYRRIGNRFKAAADRVTVQNLCESLEIMQNFEKRNKM